MTFIRAVRNVCLIALALLVSLETFAQKVLKDPTRPANKVVQAEDIDEEGNPLGPGAEGEEAAQTAFPSPKVAAIVVTDELKYAIINNEVVHEGQVWRNVKLAKIKPYSITLAIDDQTKEITINNNDFITESDENF